MGADIHAYLEVNTIDAWIAVTGELDLYRNYALFDLLGYGTVGLNTTIRRGRSGISLPSIPRHHYFDVNEISKQVRDCFLTDSLYHSPAVVTYEEWHNDLFWKSISDPDEDGPKTYQDLVGQHNWNLIEEEFRKAYELSDHVRMVYWFDN